MEKLKNYLVGNFEQVFVVLVLVATVTINYFIPQKLAFLDFYYLPVILGAYYLGRRRAVLGAMLCVALVAIYVTLYPQDFIVDTNEFSTYLHFVIWAGFLILAAAVVGGLQEKLAGEVQTTRQLNQSLETSRAELSAANDMLRDYNVNLEQRVKERTFELEESKTAIEGLKKKVETALYSTMDSSVVSLMIEGRVRSEKRPMSIMFADLVGFTTYSEAIAPETVVADLNRFLHEMEPVILAYRGHIDKYMGDGIMCEFGAPLEYPTHRLMAVVAAIKMQQAISRCDLPWKMRIGVASGTAIAGLIGTIRQTYTAIGDVVNLAARLEKFCAPGRILIDSYTQEDVGYFFETRKVRDLPTKDTVNPQKEQELEALHEKILENPASPDLYFRTGEIHLEIREPMEALQYFERALQLDPGNTRYKVSYAEADLTLKEFEKISLKGLRQRVQAFEVTAMTDQLENRAKLPQAFCDEYKPVADRINILNDVTLPTEVLDGSIGHSRVVGTLSYAIAGVMGLAESEKLDILQAGFLADIGKSIIPHYLLNRRSGLTQGEIDIIQQHPNESCSMMRKMGREKPAVLTIVQHSHERYDGTGYPEGLSGSAIPVGSRIIAVADAYDALTSWRPYRKPWERTAALAEIRNETERRIFDPAVVSALARLIA